MMFKKSLKMAGSFAVLIIFLLSFSLAAAAGQFSNWQYVKDIFISGGVSKGDLVKLTLDQEVFSNSKEDLSDLRIYAGNNEVPYKLIVESGIFSRENIYPVVVLNNSYNAEGGYNIFIVDFGLNGFLNSSLNILTNSENFKRTVEVSGGNDMESWNILKSNGYIYDYTDRAGNFKAQNTTVNYSENAFRYVQVKIFAKGEMPLTIIGVQASKIKKSESRETVFNPAYSVKENSVKRTTEIIVDLGKKGWPTSDIALVSPVENFNREVVVYESSDKNIWRMVGQSYVFNYNTPKFVGENLTVGYSETSQRYLKLEIFNGDNRPIIITGISAKTILRSIVFQYGLGDGGSPYKLYYGNLKANFPDYDLEKFFPYLDTENYFSAMLSGEQPNPAYEKEVLPLPPLTERIPYLVPGVLVLVVLIMSVIVLKFMKKVGSDK